LKTTSVRVPLCQEQTMTNRELCALLIAFAIELKVAPYQLVYAIVYGIRDGSNESRAIGLSTSKEHTAELGIASRLEEAGRAFEKMCKRNNSKNIVVPMMGHEDRREDMLPMNETPADVKHEELTDEQATDEDDDLDDVEPDDDDEDEDVDDEEE